MSQARDELRENIHDMMAKCAISYKKYGGGGRYFYVEADQILSQVDTYVKGIETAARIDEAEGVQLTYGKSLCMAQTQVGGKWQTIIKRLEDLRAEQRNRAGLEEEKQQ